MGYGNGSKKITGVALFTGLDADTVEILEDSTGFATANMETKQHPSGAFAAAVEMVSGGGSPDFNATGHVKGELIRLKSNEQRIVALQLASGSCMVYNSGTL